MRFLGALAALLLVGCSSEAPQPRDSENLRDAEVAPERPKPRGVRITYSSTCQDEFPTVLVPKGDGSEFVADVTVFNRGGVTASVLVSVRWLLVGGEQVRSEPERVVLDPGGKQTVGFTVSAGEDQVARMRAHGPGDELCVVSALSGRA